jgi:hypothetical protein
MDSNREIERIKKDYLNKLKESVDERNVDSFTKLLKVVRDQSFSFAISVEKTDADDKQLHVEDYSQSLSQEPNISYGEPSMLSRRGAAISASRDEGELLRTISKVDRPVTE